MDESRLEIFWITDSCVQIGIWDDSDSARDGQSEKIHWYRAVNSVYMKAYEKSIDISLDEFQDVQIVHDSKWTGEVFVNILDNAVKYSPEHTEIRIRVTELATCMMLEFIDQGTGIPAEEAHRVFQRFYRGNQEYVKKQEGLWGWTLSCQEKILEEQKGTICVKVAPEGGNNFVVTLPKK